MSQEQLKSCPLCGELNNDDWPLEIDGEIIEGGCQTCFERQCDRDWWAIGKILEELEDKVDVKN